MVSEIYYTSYTYMYMYAGDEATHHVLEILAQHRLRSEDRTFPGMCYELESMRELGDILDST